MSVFLLLYLTVYGFFHFFLLNRFRRLFPWRHGWMLIGVFLCVSMMASPIASRVLATAGHLGLARPLALIGYAWMGFIFLAFFAALAADAICFAIRAATRQRITASRKNTKMIWLPFAAAAILFGYGLLEAGSLTTETVTIRSAKLKPDAAITIALISDVHVGLLNGKEKIALLTAKVAELSPDLIISAGDLIDGPVSERRRLTGLFASLAPALGKFAVIGNHEYYAGLEYSLEMLTEAGFTVLRDESLPLPGGVILTGIDDASPNPARAFANWIGNHGSNDGSGFRLVIRHRPETKGTSENDINLQLSGHTHQGQIFPFSLATKLAYPAPTGLSSIAGGGSLYHSRGSGTWGPMIRILAPPEITLIRLLGEHLEP